MSVLSGAPISGSVETQHSIKAVSPVSGAGGNAGGPASRLPDALFPSHGRGGCGVSCHCSLLKPVRFSRSALHILARPISPRNRHLQNDRSDSRLSGGPHAGVAHSPPSSVGGVAPRGPAKMAHSATAINIGREDWYRPKRYPNVGGIHDGDARGRFGLVSGYRTLGFDALSRDVRLPSLHMPLFRLA